MTSRDPKGAVGSVILATAWLLDFFVVTGTFVYIDSFLMRDNYRPTQGIAFDVTNYLADLTIEC